jgi:hypothetical protein
LRSATAFLQRRGRSTVHQREARHAAEEKAGDDRETEREQEHRAVDRDRERIRRTAEAEPADHRDACIRKRESDRAARERKHQVFDEQLACDAQSAGTERGAHGHFLLPRRQTRQHEIGDVGARDQQHAGDQRLQKP